MCNIFHLRKLATFLWQKKPNVAFISDPKNARTCVCVCVVQVAVRFIDSTSLAHKHSHTRMHLWLCKARSARIQVQSCCRCRCRCRCFTWQSGKKGFNSASQQLRVSVCAHLSLYLSVCGSPQGLITFILFSRVSCFINDAHDKTHFLYACHTL